MLEYMDQTGGGCAVSVEVDVISVTTLLVILRRRAYNTVRRACMLLDTTTIYLTVMFLLIDNSFNFIGPWLP